MANQEYSGQPGDHEEEYHYTDEQPEYDLGGEKKAATKSVTAGSVFKNFGEKITQNRRIIFAIFAFLFLLLIVYRMIVPVSKNVGADDLTQGMTPVSLSAKNQVKPVNTFSRTEEAKTKSPIAVENQPTTGAVVMSGSELIKQLSEKVASLEQQNTAIMNLLQTQFMQKISDADAQRSQMRSQFRELESHVDAMESAFHQLTKIIDGGAPNKSASGQANANAQTAVLSTNAVVAQAAPASLTSQQLTAGYSVQAIIPGRAWLKSDAGETLTVADGDVLKGVGRVSRIDPYDGVVAIDTGKKIITLTYGMGGDQA